MKRSWKTLDVILPDGLWLLWEERVFTKVDKGKKIAIFSEMFERVGGPGRKRVVAKCGGDSGQTDRASRTLILKV